MQLTIPRKSSEDFFGLARTIRQRTLGQEALDNLLLAPVGRHVLHSGEEDPLSFGVRKKMIDSKPSSWILALM